MLPAPAGYSYNSSPEENLVNVNDNDNIKSKKTQHSDTFVMDVGYPVYDYKECQTNQEALEYGKDRLRHSNANSVTVYDSKLNIIGDFDCMDV